MAKISYGRFSENIVFDGQDVATLCFRSTTLIVVTLPTSNLLMYQIRIFVTEPPLWDYRYEVKTAGYISITNKLKNL